MTGKLGVMHILHCVQSCHNYRLPLYIALLLALSTPCSQLAKACISFVNLNQSRTRRQETIGGMVSNMDYTRRLLDKCAFWKYGYCHSNSIPRHDSENFQNVVEKSILTIVLFCSQSWQGLGGKMATVVSCLELIYKLMLLRSWWISTDADHTRTKRYHARFL